MPISYVASTVGFSHQREKYFACIGHFPTFVFYGFKPRVIALDPQTSNSDLAHWLLAGDIRRNNTVLLLGL